MRYLNEGMTAEVLRKTYRALAKEMHPDAGGDEEAFKVLANEYATLQKRLSIPPIVHVDEMLREVGKLVVVIADVLTELYPRTRVVLNYSFTSIDAEVYGNVPVERIVDIEEVINSLCYPLATTMLFKRAARKAWITLYSKMGITYINMAPEQASTYVVAKKGRAVYSGRRYTITQESGGYEECVDEKRKRIYVMRQVRRLPLRELMGLGTV